MTKKKQPRLPKVIRVGTRKPAKNREQTSARVAQAAGRLLKPNFKRRRARRWLLELALNVMSRPTVAAYAVELDAMLRDGQTVAGSALTQTPDRKK